MPSDNPIRSSSEDRLDRAPFARVLAQEIRSTDASEGCVLAILAPWGAGKTSLLAMICEDLSGGETPYPVLHFNPWMFSGSDQLVDIFLTEVGAQLRSRAEHLGDQALELADSFDKYAELLSPIRYVPIVGSWFERLRWAVGGLRKLAAARAKGVDARRNDLGRRLRSASMPIIIVVDDIDRLPSGEIRELFKLIRLTASFPNLIYLTAFDRARVEAALQDDRIPGRDYLEKIVQIGWDLPVARRDILVHQLTTSLDEELTSLGVEYRLDEAAWIDALVEIIVPLIRNMRDVRRYVASVRATVTVTTDQVELTDILALEAIRILLPDSFAWLCAHPAAFTSTASGYGSLTVPEPGKELIERFVASDKDKHEVLDATVRRIFPAAQRHIGGSTYQSTWQSTWLKARRTAHPDVLNFYLEKVAGGALTAVNHVENALSITHPVALKIYLDALPGDELANVIPAFELFEGEFPDQSIVPLAITLLDLVPQLPEKSTAMFALEPQLIVSRVVLRLLRQISAPSAVRKAVESIIAGVGSLSAKFELLQLVGHDENVGHGLIEVEDAHRLEEDFRDEVRSAASRVLVREWELLRLLYWVKSSAQPHEPPLKFPVDAEFYAALLQAARSTVKSQSMGARAVRQEVRLHWDVLLELLGGDELQQMVTEVRRTRPSHELVDLAERYLQGWRPPERAGSGSADESSDDG